jgi:putative FmdB family regulatory protein
MPIYEYKCQSCGHELEKLQRMNDERLKDCPECGKAELHRLVSAAGFRLKGAGWYETDFKKGSKKNLHDSGTEKSTDSKKDTSDSGKHSGAKKTESGAKTSKTIAD